MEQWMPEAEPNRPLFNCFYPCLDVYKRQLLEYDQVINEQREIIYAERRRVLDGESMRDTIYNMITEYVENVTCLLYTSRCVSETGLSVPFRN